MVIEPVLADSLAEAAAVFQEAGGVSEAVARVEDGNQKVKGREMKIIRSQHPVYFFSRKEKQKIEASIREAEQQTSGEIRVHLVGQVQGDILTSAREMFEKMDMNKTQARNGVLIFLEVQNRRFAILGDSGIHEKVPEGFWKEIILLMENSFRQDRFADGMIEGVLKIGEKLKHYFPRQSSDRNEVSDKISCSL